MPAPIDVWSETVDRLTTGSVLRWLLPAGWPMHLAFALSVAATGAVAMLTEQPAIMATLLGICLHYGVGLCGSFGLHELGHVLVLLRAAGSAGVILERTAWRISVAPAGPIRGRDVFLGALAGPGGCAVVGAALMLCCPQALLHVWFFAHVAFLLPLFGDGRAGVGHPLMGELARWWPLLTGSRYIVLPCQHTIYRDPSQHRRSRHDREVAHRPGRGTRHRH